MNQLPQKEDDNSLSPDKEEMNLIDVYDVILAGIEQ